MSSEEITNREEIISVVGDVAVLIACIFTVNHRINEQQEKRLRDYATDAANSFCDVMEGD